MTRTTRGSATGRCRKRGRHPAPLLESVRRLPRHPRRGILVGRGCPVQDAPQRHAHRVQPPHTSWKPAKTVHTRDGVDTCITDVAWDFSWQRVYSFAEPVEVNVGDTFDLTCTFDNTRQPAGGGRRTLGPSTSAGVMAPSTRCASACSSPCPSSPTCRASAVASTAATRITTKATGPAPSPAMPRLAARPASTCGLEALFGPCATPSATPRRSAQPAAWRPAERRLQRLLRLHRRHLRRVLRDLFACARPLFEEGTCTADYAMCQGIVP